MASTMFARPSSPTPLSPVLANIPTPEAFTRPSSPAQSPPATPTAPHMPPGYIPRRRSAIILTSTGPCSFTPRRRNALVPLPLLPPVPPDAIVTSVKILHNDSSNQNSSYSFGSHCRQNYGAEITCGSITFTNSFACSPPPRRRRSSLNPLACAAAAANVAAAAHAQAQTQPRMETVQDVTMTDANVPAAKAAATGTDQLVTVVSSPTLTKTANRNGEERQPDSPTKTSFFFSPLARSRNQRRRTSCTPCNVPAPIQTTKAAHGKPSPPPTAPLPPTPTTPTVPSTPMPSSVPSMPSMPSTPMPIVPRSISPIVPATPNNSLDGALPKPRSTIVVTVRMSPSATRRDAFTPPASPWPRDSPFPWSNAYSGNPKPTRDLVLAQKETTIAANPVTEAVASAMAMDVDPTPLEREREVQRARAHRSAPAVHNPAFLASIRLKNERSRRFNMPHPSPGLCPSPSIRRSGPGAPVLPSKPLWNRPRVSSRLVTRPSMTPELMDAASHTVSLGGNRVTAQLSPQFSADQLYISQPTLHPRLPGRTVSSSRLISASRAGSDPESTGSGFTGSTYVARASGVRSVAGKPMRAANKSASKSGGLPMLRTAVINNSGPDVGRRIVAMGVHLAKEIYEAEEDLARQDNTMANEEDRMDMDLDVEEPAFQPLPPPPRSRYPRSRSQPRAQVEADVDMDVEKFLEHYVTGGDVEMEGVQAERVDLHLRKEESSTSTLVLDENEKKISQDSQTTKAVAAAAATEEDEAKENKPTQAIMGIKTMATIQDTNDRRFSSEMV